MITQYLIFFLSICVTNIHNCKRGYVILGNGVHKNDVETIIKKHNTLRTSLTKGKVGKQPQGVDIQNLTWDASLADQAQMIASTCIFEHVKVKDGRWYVGQNLYLQKSSDVKKIPDWGNAIQMWFDEHKTYSYGVYDACSKDAGHYTQVVWANSKYIGCGYTVYKRKWAYTSEKLYVCNYGPGGNLVGQYPYKKKED